MSSFRSLPTEILYQVFDYIPKGDDLVAILAALRTKSGDSTIECVLRDREFRFSDNYTFHNSYLTARDLEFNNHVILRAIMPIDQHAEFMFRRSSSQCLNCLKNLFSNEARPSVMSVGCRMEIVSLALSQYSSRAAKILDYLLAEYPVEFGQFRLLVIDEKVIWRLQERASYRGLLKVFQWSQHQFPIDLKDCSGLQVILQNAVKSRSLPILKYVVGLGVPGWMICQANMYGHLLIVYSLQNESNAIFEFLLDVIRSEPYSETYVYKVLKGVCGRHGNLERFKLVVESFPVSRVDFVPTHKNRIIETACKNAQLSILQYIVREFKIEREEVTNSVAFCRIGSALISNKLNRREMLQVLGIKHENVEK